MKKGLIVMSEGGMYLIEGRKQTHGGSQPTFTWTPDINDAELYCRGENQLANRLKKDVRNYVILEATSTRQVRLITPERK